MQCTTLLLSAEDHLSRKSNGKRSDQLALCTTLARCRERGPPTERSSVRAMCVVIDLGVNAARWGQLRDLHLVRRVA